MVEEKDEENVCEGCTAAEETNSSLVTRLVGFLLVRPRLDWLRRHTWSTIKRKLALIKRR